MGDIEARKIGERQIERADPRRFRGRRIEPGQHEEIAGARRRNIPEPDALATQFVLLCLARGAIAIGRDTQDRAVEGVGVAVDYGAVGRHHAGHGIDGDDDWPFEAFGGAHGEERDGFFLRDGPAFDGAGLIRPGRGHRLGEGAKAAHGIPVDRLR